MVKRKNNNKNTCISEKRTPDGDLETFSQLHNNGISQYHNRYFFLQKEINFLSALFYKASIKQNDPVFQYYIDNVRLMINALETIDKGTIEHHFRDTPLALEFFEEIKSHNETPEVDSNLDFILIDPSSPRPDLDRNHDDSLIVRLKTFINILQNNSQIVEIFRAQTSKILSNSLSDSILIKLIIFQHICQQEIKIQLCKGSNCTKSFTYILSKRFLKKYISQHLESKEITYSCLHKLINNGRMKEWLIKKHFSEFLNVKFITPYTLSRWHTEDDTKASHQYITKSEMTNRFMSVIYKFYIKLYYTGSRGI